MKTFKCLSCGHIFSSETEATHCPSCNSENLTPHKKSKSFVVLGGFFVLCVLIGVGVAVGIEHFTKDSGAQTGNGAGVVTEQTEQVAVNTGVQPGVQPATSEKQPTSGIPTFSVSTPQLVNGKYNFAVTVDNTKGINWISYLKIPGAEKPAYESSTGSFSKVEPVEDGRYILVLENKDTQEKQEVDVLGFDKPKALTVEKLTQEQLQQIFCEGAAQPADMQWRFAYGYKMKFVGLDEDESVNPPTRYSEIFNRMINWSSLTITSVNYNSANQITHITFNVTY